MILWELLKRLFFRDIYIAVVILESLIIPPQTEDAFMRDTKHHRRLLTSKQVHCAELHIQPGPHTIVILTSLSSWSRYQMITSLNGALPFSPAVFIVGQNITLVIYTGHTVLVSVFWGKQFTCGMLALPAPFCVFWVIVPQ